MSTISSVFKGWDNDTSGAVSRVEFQQGLAKMGLHPDETQMQAVFRRIDKDHSGYVDFKELRRALEPWLRPAKPTAAAGRRVAKARKEPPKPSSWEGQGVAWKTVTGAGKTARQRQLQEEQARRDAAAYEVARAEAIHAARATPGGLAR